MAATRPPSKYSVHKASSISFARSNEKKLIYQLEEEKDPLGRLEFIRIILLLLCDIKRDYLCRLTIKELSEYMMGLDNLNIGNIYRKSHGNLSQLLKRKDFEIFNIENNVITFNEEKLENAIINGTITEQNYEDSLDAIYYSNKEKRFILYNSNMNFCKRHESCFFILLFRCKQTYSNNVATIKACNNEIHNPTYNWILKIENSDLKECEL